MNIKVLFLVCLVVVCHYTAVSMALTPEQEEFINNLSLQLNVSNATFFSLFNFTCTIPENFTENLNITYNQTVNQTVIFEFNSTAMNENFFNKSNINNVVYNLTDLVETVRDNLTGQYANTIEQLDSTLLTVKEDYVTREQLETDLADQKSDIYASLNAYSEDNGSALSLNWMATLALPFLVLFFVLSKQNAIPVLKAKFRIPFKRETIEEVTSSDEYKTKIRDLWDLKRIALQSTLKKENINKIIREIDEGTIRNQPDLDRIISVMELEEEHERQTNSAKVFKTRTHTNRKGIKKSKRTKT